MDPRGGVAVQLRERFQIALRMAGRHAGRRIRRRAAHPSARQALGAAALRRQPQLVRIFLLEAEAGLAAVDPQAQAVFTAGRHLAAPQHAARAVGVTQHDLHVIVQLASRREGVQFGQDLARQHAADIARQVVGVTADIAQAAVRAGAQRIVVPVVALKILALVGRLGQPVLRVFHLHQPDLAG